MQVLHKAVKAGGLLYMPEGLVLVERKGTGVRDGLVIPKGSPKLEDTDLSATAIRELYEETGYRAKISLFLGNVSRPSIDTLSTDPYKKIEVFLMDQGVLDPTVIPEEAVRLVDPYEAAHGNIMRYPQEQEFIARHLATLVRGHSWQEA